MTNKYDRLIGNSAVFAIGNLGSKLIQVLLVPLYTYFLSKPDYGVVDLLTTTVNLLLPIVSLSVYDAILRFVMDAKEDNRTVFSNALFITCVGAVISLLFVPVLSRMGISNVFLTVLLLVVQSFQALSQQFARAINRVKDFAVNGILTTFVTAILNVILLVILKTGISGYLWSMIGAASFSITFLGIRLHIKRFISTSTISKSKIRSLLIFSIPLIPNSLAWWVSNASSRYFVLLFVGVGANGLFAVANKIPSMLSMLNNIFFQSWQMSAIEEYESPDKSVFYSRVFNFFANFLFWGTSVILFILRPFMSKFVSNDFYESWRYVPFLLIAIIYSSFATFLGTSYIAAKKTGGAFTTTIIGAILNVVLNIFLVRHWGLYGAGISSSISYLVMWIIRIFDTKRFVKLKIPVLRIIFNQMLILLQIYVLYFIRDYAFSYCLLAALTVVSSLYNRSIFLALKNRLKQKRQYKN